jgi:hypothetical protein
MRLKSFFYSFLFVSMFLVSCEFKCQVGDATTKEEKDGEYKPVSKEGALLYNGIEVKTNNVKIEKAYLVYRDNGELIDETNFVDMKRGLKLLVLVESGWKETETGVSLGASMRSTSEDGEELLNKRDMFEGAGSFSATDSKIIGLSLYFKEWAPRTPVTINTIFRIWDKNSDASVEGSYTIHTK